VCARACVCARVRDEIVLYSEVVRNSDIPYRWVWDADVAHWPRSLFRTSQEPAKLW